MAVRGKISELYDIEAIKAQQQEVIGFVDSFIQKTANTKPIKFSLESAEKTKDVLKGVTELSLATKEYEKIANGTALAQAKLNALNSEAAKKNAEVKVQVTEQNKILREQAKEALNVGDAYDKLTREYNAAAKEARNLAIQYGAQSKEAQEASKKTLELDQRLKAADANVGRFNKNVGNYSGALKTLEKALDDVKKKMDDATKSGNQNENVVKQLEKEYQLLNQLVNNQVNGFASASSELKNNEKALQALGQAGLQTTEFYQQLLKETAQLKDNVGDLKAEIKNLASDTSTLDGLIGAAQTLAGAYGIAQGAAALFGDENKDLQETFVKLQAVMTILSGLQSIQNALQKESSVRLLINTGLQKLQVLQTNLQAAAESRSIIVRYLAIAAQKALNAVMALSAGPIGIIVGALALLVISLKAYASGNENALKSLKDLNVQLDVSKSFLDEELNAIKNSNKEREAELRKRFATEKEVRDQSIKGQQREIESLKTFEEQNANAYDKALETFRKYHKNHKSVDEDALNESIDIINKYEDVIRDRLNKETEFNVQSLENERTAAVEGAALRRIQLQAQIENAGTRADLFNRIATDEFNSYEVRKKALVNFFNEQQRINELTKKQALDNPELKAGERALVETQARNKAIQLRRDQAAQTAALTREETQREKQAQLSIARENIQAAADTAQAILSNNQRSFNDRLAAADSFYQSQKALIETQRDFDLSNAQLTSSEKKAIVQKSNDDLLALQRDFGVQVNDLLIAQLDKEQQTRVSNSNKERDDAITALNNKFNAGKIGVDKYERERLEIERKASLQSLEIILQEVNKTIALYQQLGYDTTELEAQASELKKQISDEEKDHKKKNIEELKEFEKQAAQEVYDTVISFVGSSFDRRKNEIQGQIDALDKQKEKDIEVANSSIANATDRANTIQTINTRAAAQKEALERRQRQLDVERAKFEKAANIGKIIAETAVAVVHQLGSGDAYTAFTRAVLVGTIGALQLAQAIAAPIPKFKHGVDDSPEGLAWVGDGYKREPIITPDGKLYMSPAFPTLVDLPRHSTVLSDESKLMDYMTSSMQDRHLQMSRHQPAMANIDELIMKGMERHTGRIVQAIMNKREHNFHWSNGQLRQSIKNGNEINHYLNDNLDF